MIFEMNFEANVYASKLFVDYRWDGRSSISYLLHLCFYGKLHTPVFLSHGVKKYLISYLCLSLLCYVVLTLDLVGTNQHKTVKIWLSCGAWPFPAPFCRLVATPSNFYNQKKIYTYNSNHFSVKNTSVQYLFQEGPANVHASTCGVCLALMRLLRWESIFKQP